MRRSVVAVFVCAIVIAAAGCSSGSDDASDEADVVDTNAGSTSAATTVADTEPDSTPPPDTDPATSEPAPTEPTASQPDDSEPPDSGPTDTEPDPADVAIAEAALLTLDDMPQGWTESPLDDEEDDEAASADAQAAQRQFNDCFGIDTEADHDPFGIGGARASSGEFADTHDFTISNTVTIADVEGVSLVMERYSAESVPECVAPAMVAVVEAGFAGDPDLAAFEVGEVTVEQLDLTTWGDATVGYRIFVPVTSPDASFDLWMDQIVVHVGRGLTSLQFQSPNSPFEVFEVDSYAMLAAERLTEALA